MSVNKYLYKYKNDKVLFFIEKTLWKLK
jgi:hypothetical protein